MPIGDQEQQYLREKQADRCAPAPHQEQGDEASVDREIVGDEPAPEMRRLMRMLIDVPAEVRDMVDRFGGKQHADDELPARLEPGVEMDILLVLAREDDCGCKGIKGREQDRTPPT